MVTKEAFKLTLNKYLQIVLPTIPYIVYEKGVIGLAFFYLGFIYLLKLTFKDYAKYEESIKKICIVYFLITYAFLILGLEIFANRTSLWAFILFSMLVIRRFISVFTTK